MTLNDLSNLNLNRDNSVVMPMLFVGHGSPMNAIEENEFVTGWRSQAATLPRPSAILCISAHWETRGTYVTAMAKPQTIHDFGGFPCELYQVQYPAPGNPGLANEVTKLITGTPVFPDEKWGLDHGTWSVIKHFYPEADIPVVQLSINYLMSPRHHYELAKELAILRSKGVLIVGSGNIVHNLRVLNWSNPNEGYDWAINANEKVKSLILKNDYTSLIDYTSLGNDVKMAIPTAEHFLPLLYILGLKKENEELSFFNDKAVYGSLTMTSVRVG
ncbi:MAG: 4,5-DOPA dioxygenase extradiol [Bacteroidota bacterium]|nr:4,5-DOPA dioxygenase extradiol [Bacteroidota bacterium]